MQPRTRGPGRPAYETDPAKCANNKLKAYLPTYFSFSQMTELQMVGVQLQVFSDDFVSKAKQLFRVYELETGKVMKKVVENCETGQNIFEFQNGNLRCLRSGKIVCNISPQILSLHSEQLIFGGDGIGKWHIILIPVYRHCAFVEIQIIAKRFKLIDFVGSRTA